MTALAYLHENGLEAEPLRGDQVAVWPEQSITPAMELWIIEHKAQLVTELCRSGQSAKPCREQERAWRSAHDSFINHIMACSACYAPRDRYCTTGADLRRVYLQTYQNADEPE